MIANYHTHTWRCNHAQDTEKEYVERAVEGGIRILGFSDHTPYGHLSSPDNTVRMQMKQFDDYVNTVLSLRDEYASDIQIHLGVEVEYYPDHFEDLMLFFEDYPVEYMLLGQHYLDNEIGGAQYSGRRTYDPNHLVKYVDQSIEAMETGGFLYMAHPDLLNFCGDQEIYYKEYKRLCEAAKEHDLPLEINLLGIRTRRWYPNGNFWKIAGEVGNDVIIGCDAHKAVDTFDPESETEVRSLIVEKNHLHLLEKMELDVTDPEEV